MSLEFDFDWLDAQDVAGPDRYTWAAFATRVGGHNLDAVDVRHRRLHRHVATSLLPFVEWMIDVWPRLTEERNHPLATAAARRSWRRHHDLASGRGGGPMPSVVLHRIDESSFRLRCRDDAPRPPGISVRFHGEHDEIGSARTVIRELARVIEAVLAQLAAPDPWLHDDLRRRWTEAQTPAALVAGRLGWATLADATDDDRASFKRLAAEPDLLALVEAIADQDLTSRVASAERLRRVLSTEGASTPASTTWQQMRMSSTGRAPWHVGWSAAAEVRDRLGLVARDPPAGRLQALLAERAGWPIAQQHGALRERPRGVDLVVVTQPGLMPWVLSPAVDERAKRFRVAKSLYLALCAEEPASGGIIVDTVRAARHSEANAFAAELLAPAAFLSTLTPVDGTWEQEDLEDAARRCAVDQRVIEHQVENRQLGSLPA